MLQIKRFPNRAADLKAFVEEMTPAQVGFLTQVLLETTQGDYTAIPEIFTWLANRWDDMDERARLEAAQEGEQRWFTEAALVRYHEEAQNARDAYLRAQQAGIINPHTGRPFGT